MTGDETRPAAPVIGSLEDRFGEVVSLLRGVASRIDPIADDARRRARLFDDLHAEMRLYRDDFLFRAQKPLFMDLILLHDAVDRLSRKWDERAEVRADMDRIREELLEVLYRHDIERIGARPKKLDVGIQRPIRRVDTDDPDEDRDVVEYVQEGFVRNDTVLRPQMVVVRRHAVRDEREEGARR